MTGTEFPPTSGVVGDLSIGVLMLDTHFRRLPGDIGNGRSWPFPVQFRVVRGADPAAIVHGRPDAFLEPFIAAAHDLIGCGVRGITTSCGFLALLQKELAAALPVPVATSSLLQAPLIEAMLPQGLQRVADAAVVAVIDGEHRSGHAGETGCEARHDRDGRAAGFDDRADRQALRGDRRTGARTKAEGEGVVNEADHALGEAILGPHILADRQRIEEFVGDDDQRPVGEFLNARCEEGRVRGQLLLLYRPQMRARLDQHDVRRGEKIGRETGGAQRVGHQRAAAGAELGEHHARRAAHPPPGFHRPEADEFAEHLADLGGGDEIAGRAEGIAAHVIAMLRIAEAGCHVVGDGDRSIGADARGEP